MIRLHYKHVELTKSSLDDSENTCEHSYQREMIYLKLTLRKRDKKWIYSVQKSDQTHLLSTTLEV